MFIWMLLCLDCTTPNFNATSPVFTDIVQCENLAIGKSHSDEPGSHFACVRQVIIANED